MLIDKVNLVGWQEVCKILGISQAYYRYLIAAKRLPGRKIGKTWVFVREDIGKLREERVKKAKTDKRIKLK